MLRWAPLSHWYSLYLWGNGWSVWPQLLTSGWHLCLLHSWKDQSYSRVLSWVTNFSLLRSAVAHFDGAMSHRGNPATIGALDLAISEGQVLPFR